MAQLGCGFNERAYTSSSTALRIDENDKMLRAGRDAWLALVAHWTSETPSRRRIRFSKDLQRPSATQKHIVSLMSTAISSQINIGSKVFIERSVQMMFLIIAGNLADPMKATDVHTQRRQLVSRGATEIDCKASIDDCTSRCLQAYISVGPVDLRILRIIFAYMLFIVNLLLSCFMT